MIVRPKNKGFTLIELMFAMAFVAFLMIFIVSSVVQIMRIYNKGLAIRDINQSGRQLNEDMTRSLRYANSLQFSANGETIASTNQRICANGVTYAWNLDSVGGLVMKNKYAAPDAATPCSFIRVDDRNGLLCEQPTFAIPKTNARDLLSPQLTVQRLTLTVKENGRIVDINALFSTQGLNRPVISTTTPSGFECPTGGDGAFCAFGEFQTTVYVRN